MCIRDSIKEHIDIVERAKKAMRKAGVEPQITPIRGGTDGARLSFEDVYKRQSRRRAARRVRPEAQELKEGKYFE